MRAGKLRHRVTIQRLIRSQDPMTGEVINDWQELATVWAAVEPLSVREFVRSAAVQSEVTVRITMRYRDVRASDRIVYRGKFYNIHGELTDPKSGLEYVTLPCSEGVNDG